MFNTVCLLFFQVTVGFEKLLGPVSVTCEKRSSCCVECHRLIMKRDEQMERLFEMT